MSEKNEYITLEGEVAKDLMSDDHGLYCVTKVLDRRRGPDPVTMKAYVAIWGGEISPGTLLSRSAAVRVGDRTLYGPDHPMSRIHGMH